MSSLSAALNGKSLGWVRESVQRGGVLPLFGLLVAIVALALFGIAGVGRGETLAGFDMQVFWAAGKAWWQGANPYDPVQLSAAAGVDLSGSPFAYPPHFAPLCLALGALPFDLARWSMVAANVAAVAITLELCGRLVTQQFPGFRDAALVCLAVGLPFTLHVVFMGQTPLIAVAAATGAVWCAQQGRFALAGALLALASVKPQLGILVVLWFLLRKEFRTLLVTATVGLVAAAIPMILMGPTELVTAWLGALENYRGEGANQVGFRHMFGIASLLHSMSMAVSGVEVLAPIGLVAVWWKRHHLSDLEVLGALLMISVLTLPVHDTDLVAIIPFLFMYAVLTRENPTMRYVGLCLLAVMFFPQRFLRPLEIRVLEQFRVPIVMAGLGLWVWLKATKQPQPAPSNGASATVRQ